MQLHPTEGNSIKAMQCVAIKIHPWESGQSLISAREVLFSFLEYIYVWDKLVALDILVYNTATDGMFFSQVLLLFYMHWPTRLLPAPLSCVLWCFLPWQPASVSLSCYGMKFCDSQMLRSVKSTGSACSAAKHSESPLSAPSSWRAELRIKGKLFKHLGNESGLVLVPCQWLIPPQRFPEKMSFPVHGNSLTGTKLVPLLVREKNRSGVHSHHLWSQLEQLQRNLPGICSSADFGKGFISFGWHRSFLVNDLS